MGVTRIVANIPAENPIELAEFYQKVFDLNLPLDMGWISFFRQNAMQ